MPAPSKLVISGVLASALCFMAAASTSGLWIDVPFIRQDRDGCGSASLAMVLRYWQSKKFSVSEDRTDPARIQRELYQPKLRGISASQMEQYVRDSGFDAFAFRADWSDIRQNIAKGRPLIAGLKPRNEPAHYVVVVGAAPDESAALVNDPERGKLVRIARRDFEKAWKGTDNWTLLAVPKQR